MSVNHTEAVPTIAESSKPFHVCLLGNPNTGKTSLFNALCGTHQIVGNYPGVTVEKKIGHLKIGDHKITLVDLPGLYSLRADSPDEAIAEAVLQGKQPGLDRPDLIIVVLDATNLRRNLLLFSQVVELGLPTMVALTMTDQLPQLGIQLDLPLLSEQLGVPVLPIAGRDGQRLAQLRKAIDNHLTAPQKPTPLGLDAKPMSAEAEANTSAATARFAWAKRIVEQVEHRDEVPKQVFGRKLDRLLTHRLAGLLIFVGIMYLMFQSIYSWSGPLMDLIDASFGALGESVSPILAGAPMLQSLIVEGIIGGVGSVVIFLPQILILFAFVAFMEDSGYLARVAFLMDKLMSWSGLNGRAFIPLLSGFACAIPAVMATRVMPDPKSRLVTILITPLMSCSARLPVYLLLIGTFIEPLYGAAWAAFALFAMHALGLVLAVPLAWFFNRGFLKSKPLPFLLEMPPYRMPYWRNVILRSWGAGRKFLIQAGTIILALSLVVWALSYFPRPDAVNQNVQATYQAEFQALEQANLTPDVLAERRAELETKQETALASAYLNQSFLARMGKFVQPVFAPLGFDWKMTVGILAAFPAREVIIATMGIIFELGDVDEESSTLRDQLRHEKKADGQPVYGPLVAICLMVFFALCCQCMSTLAAIKRELNSYKWPIFVFTYMTALAYIVTLAIYQIGRLFGMA